MSQRIKNLNTIVATLRAGESAYRDAAGKVSDAELGRTCDAHADLRESAASEIAAVVDDLGGEPAEPSAIEKAREMVAKASAAIGDTDSRLVAHLEEHEDRTLEAFREAIRHGDNAPDQELLERHRDRFKEAHDKMRELKKAA